jgi:hypothetical protein
VIYGLDFGDTPVKMNGRTRVELWARKEVLNTMAQSVGVFGVEE